MRHKLHDSERRVPDQNLVAPKWNMQSVFWSAQRMERPSAWNLQQSKTPSLPVQWYSCGHGHPQNLFVRCLHQDPNVQAHGVFMNLRHALAASPIRISKAYTVICRQRAFDRFVRKYFIHQSTMRDWVQKVKFKPNTANNHLIRTPTPTLNHDLHQRHTLETDIISSQK
jgi:hypothetical protein